MILGENLLGMKECDEEFEMSYIEKRKKKQKIQILHFRKKF
jgi:hypothetical protein